MDKTAKVYREERADVIAQMEQMAEVVKNESRAFSQEELEEYDAFDEQQGVLEMSAKSIERIEKLGSYAVKQSQDRQILHADTGRKITGRDVDMAFRAFALSNSEFKLTDDMLRAADKLELNLNASMFTIKMEQTTDVTTQGGYLLNDSIYSGIDTALLAYGGAIQNARVLNTGTGETLHFVTVDDSANEATAHVEVATVGNTDVVFGRVQLSAFSRATSVFPISYELLTDSQFPIGPYVGELLGERVARDRNELLTNGVGTTEPRGFLLDSVLGSTCTNNAIVADDLYDLYFSVDSAYRSSPSCAFQMNDATLAAIVALDDLDGRPLWGAGLNAAPGSTILGKPVIVNNDMPVMVATERNAIIAFGDWSRFYVRIVQPGVTISKLSERYAQEMSIGILAYNRFDSAIVNSGTDPIKHMLGTDSGSS
jgi:HK97 family phage major capsid protein